MPYYLSSYIGTGSRCDPFRPLGSEQRGWSAIDIRPDASKKDGGGLNACLLHLPQHDPSRGLYQIADDSTEVLGRQVHTAASALLHLAKDKAIQLREFVADLLIAPPPHGWNPLQPSGRHPLFRRYQIYLGGLLWDQPVLAGGTTLSETWSTADSASLDSSLTWNEYFGGGWAISSNKARLAGSANSNQVLCLSSVSTKDMEVSGQIVTWTHTANFLVYMVTGRLNPSINSTSTTWDWYGYGVANNFGVTNEHSLEKYVAGAQTVIATEPTDITVNETIKLRCSGSSISGYINGVLNIGPSTDTTHTNVGTCGFYGYSNGPGNVLEVDNWAAADYLPPSAPMFRGS